jgi:hypothetical protein
MGRRAGVSWANRQCKRCSANHLGTLACGVDDEYHLLFECESTAALRSDVRFGSLMSRAWWGHGGSVRALMEGDTSLVMEYVCKCMDIADAAPHGPQQ